MGKLIGVALGVMVGGIIGGLLGLFVGHIFDKGLMQSRMGVNQENLQEVQKTFFETTFTLLGHLAKADGRVSEAEVAQTEELMSRLGLTPNHRRSAIALFKKGSQSDFDFDVLIANFNTRCGKNSNLRQMLLVYLINMSLADGKMDAAEQTLLRKISEGIHIPGFAFEQLIRMINAQNQFGGGQSGFQQTPRADELALAYQALGVESDISDRELKKAYRKLMSQYHPDKLMGQGLPEDMIQEATERSQEVQAAYDLILKHRKNS